MGWKKDMARPNVLLICVEHWSGRNLGSAGHGCVMTPTLDSLAANGTRFTNAYSATPTCIPARRALMTGTTARTHGDRVFDETLRMPKAPTLAQVFSEAGYQTYAVGKLHVYPQRDRIGFDDVLLNEEGRHQFGLKADDYELFLAEQGYAGQEFTHGMASNDYLARPWHLPERCHSTNWTVEQMCKAIKRRDPLRPGFWYMSFQAGHPPLIPPGAYLDMYRDAEIPDVLVGDWAAEGRKLPWPLRKRRDEYWAQGHESLRTPMGTRRARQAYYAMCTHVDHQIRLVIGLLREEKLLDDTIIMFTADHGEMIGNHGFWAKDLLLEDSAKVPMIVVPTADYARMGHHQTDDRLVELRDIMPTLLDMAGLEIPETVEGVSMLSEERREYLYGEHYEDERANRMVRDERFKLIYYPVGNYMQLFDLEADPDEMQDRADDGQYGEVKERLAGELMGNLYGDDVQWVKDNKLVGLAEKEYEPLAFRGLLGQRGWRFM